MADPWGPSWHRAKKSLGLRLSPPAGWTAEADPNEPGHDHGRWSVSVSEGGWLQEQVRGKVVVEIGTGLGISTRYMAETAHLVITCDTDAWVRRAVWPDLADLDNVVFCGSIATVGTTDDWPDVVFIDGCHDTDAVEADIRDALAILQTGGRIILHDTAAESVRRAAAAVGLVVELHNYEFHNGMGVITVPETASGRCCA
jgi:hypothetical protein